MTEPKISMYWDMAIMKPGDKGFVWAPISDDGTVYTVRCKSTVGSSWHVCRAEFDVNTTKDQINQTMNTLLDVCRMRYADELLNQGEMK